MASFVASFTVLFLTASFSLYYFIDIQKLDKQDKIVVEILLLMLAVVLAYRAIATAAGLARFLKERRAAGESPGSVQSAIPGLLRRKETIFLAVTVPYIALFPILGFFTASFIYLLFGNYLLGTRDRVQIFAIPIGVTLSTYLLFGLLFGIRLPKGLLF